MGVRVGSVKRDRLGASGCSGVGAQPRAETGWRTQARLVRPLLKIHYRGFIVLARYRRDLDVDRQFQPPQPLARVFLSSYGRYRTEMDRGHDVPGLHTRREHDYHAERIELDAAEDRRASFCVGAPAHS